jgi:hypothetical protein
VLARRSLKANSAGECCSSSCWRRRFDKLVSMSERKNQVADRNFLIEGEGRWNKADKEELFGNTVNVYYDVQYRGLVYTRMCDDRHYMAMLVYWNTLFFDLL